MTHKKDLILSMKSCSKKIGRKNWEKLQTYNLFENDLIKMIKLSYFNKESFDSTLIFEMLHVLNPQPTREDYIVYFGISSYGMVEPLLNLFQEEKAKQQKQVA